MISSLVRQRLIQSSDAPLWRKWQGTVFKFMSFPAVRKATNSSLYVNNNSWLGNPFDRASQRQDIQKEFWVVQQERVVHGTAWLANLH